MNAASRVRATTLLLALPAAAAGDLTTDLDVRYGHGLDANDTVQASIDIEPVLEFEVGSQWEAVLSVSSRSRTESTASHFEPTSNSSTGSMSMLACTVSFASSPCP